MAATLRIATRGSRLARWQAERVAALVGVRTEFVIVSTTGDKDQTSDLHAIGGTGVFVKEVQQAVLDGAADVAVHSAKDLPSEPAAGLDLVCVPERADPRDALVGARFDDLPTGAFIGTGSVRRRAQLAAARPDLTFGPLRGSIETRLRKREEQGYDAVVVAAAALQRLGLEAEIAEILDPEVMLPQVAQGALAAECRADDRVSRNLLRVIDDQSAHAAVRAERAFLAELGGGCDLPCGALAEVTGDIVRCTALLSSLDGRIVLRATSEHVEPESAGVAVALELLDHAGGRALLLDAAP